MVKVLEKPLTYILIAIVLLGIIYYAKPINLAAPVFDPKMGSIEKRIGHTTTVLTWTTREGDCDISLRLEDESNPELFKKLSTTRSGECSPQSILGFFEIFIQTFQEWQLALIRLLVEALS
jgi:hypothetical protein